MPYDVANQGIDTIISGTTGQRVVVAKTATATMSTQLSYLFVARSNGLDNQYIYAAPMVKNPSNLDMNNGKIAKFDSIYQQFNRASRIQYFDTVIDDASQIDISGSPEVVARILVGAGAVPLAAGESIDQLYVQGDVAFITIAAQPSADSTPGIFSSHALFDEQGRVKGWTSWQRALGKDSQVLFAQTERSTGATMSVQGQNLSTIYQTTWNTNSALTHLTQAIESSLSFAKRGVQGLDVFGPSTPGLGNLSLVVASGKNTTLLSQTGIVSDGNLVIDQDETVITIDSSLGLSIGSVITTAFGSDENDNYYFFMGADGGLAVFSDDQTGVTFTSSLADLATLTTDGKSCKTIGTFKFVKKIIGYGPDLYILTLDGLYKMRLQADTFVLENPSEPQIEKVLHANSLEKSMMFLDMIIVDDFILIGTTNGLYSFDFTQEDQGVVEYIAIPGGYQAVTRLVPVATGGNSWYESGNLYVLSSNYSLQQTSSSRLTINQGQINPIQDQIIQGVNGPYLIFDLMMSSLFVGGSFGWTTNFKIGDIPPVLNYLDYTLHAGTSSAQYLLKGSVHRILLKNLLSSTLNTTQILQDYSSGVLMVGGDFGLLTLS